eukprot:Polyplicarium_translucidae@DN769_c0_g1_i2.p2
MFVHARAMVKQWLPIECNPDVMSAYCEKIGAPKNLGFADIFSTESWAIEILPRAVRAILVVYPINPLFEKRSQALQDRLAKEGFKAPADVWFTKQTVGNACGTVALLHCIGNIFQQQDIPEGSAVGKFLYNTGELSAEGRAKALEEDDGLEAAHKEVETAGQSRPPAPTDKVDTHFVAVVAKNGRMYELDGRKSIPLDLGAVNTERFLEKAVQYVKSEYLDVDPEELRISLLAVFLKE